MTATNMCSNFGGFRPSPPEYLEAASLEDEKSNHQTMHSAEIIRVLTEGHAEAEKNLFK